MQFILKTNIEYKQYQMKKKNIAIQYLRSKQSKPNIELLFFLQAIQITRLTNKNKYLEDKYNYLQKTNQITKNQFHSEISSDSNFQTQEIFQYYQLLEKYKGALQQIDFFLNQNLELKKFKEQCISKGKATQERQSKQKQNKDNLIKQIQELKMKYFNQQQIVDQLSNQLKKQKMESERYSKQKTEFFNNQNENNKKNNQKNFERIVLQIIFGHLNSTISRYWNVSQSLIPTLIETTLTKFYQLHLKENYKEQIQKFIKNEFNEFIKIVENKEKQKELEIKNNYRQNLQYPKIIIEKDKIIRELEKKITIMNKVYGNNQEFQENQYISQLDKINQSKKKMVDVLNLSQSHFSQKSEERSSGKISKNFDKNKKNGHNLIQQIKKLKMENQRLSYELNQYKYKRRYKHQEIEDIINLKDQNQQMKSEIIEIKTKLQKQINRLKEKNQKLKNQLQQENNKINVMEEQLQQKVNMYEKQIKELKKKLREARGNKYHFNEENQYDAQINTERKDYKQFQFLKQKNQQLILKMEQVSLRNEQLQKRIKKVNNENLKNQYVNSKSRIRKNNIRSQSQCSDSQSEKNHQYYDKKNHENHFEYLLKLKQQEKNILEKNLTNKIRQMEALINQNNLQINKQKSEKNIETIEINQNRNNKNFANEKDANSQLIQITTQYQEVVQNLQNCKQWFLNRQNMFQTYLKSIQSNLENIQSTILLNQN